MAVIDCTMIGSEYELDMLHLRCNILKDVVDEFVVVESDLTHSGQPKPDIFDAYMERPWYKQFPINFIGIVQDPNKDGWARENEQRRCMKDAMLQVHSPNSKDLVIVSDIDEVPKPGLVETFREAPLSARAVLWMHYFHLNTPVKEYQRWTKGTMFLAYPDCVSLDWHTERLGNSLGEVADAGWHWSSCLSLNGFMYKLETGLILRDLHAGHGQYVPNKDDWTKAMTLYNMGRSIHGEELSIEHFDNRYPKYLQENWRLYKDRVWNYKGELDV